MLHHQILSGFTIFKVNGWYVDFCNFGAILAHFGGFDSLVGHPWGPYEKITGIICPNHFTKNMANSISTLFVQMKHLCGGVLQIQLGKP